MPSPVTCEAWDSRSLLAKSTPNCSWPTVSGAWLKTRLAKRSFNGSIRETLSCITSDELQEIGITSLGERHLLLMRLHPATRQSNDAQLGEVVVTPTRSTSRSQQTVAPVTAEMPVEQHEQLPSALAASPSPSRPQRAVVPAASSPEKGTGEREVYSGITAEKFLEMLRSARNSLRSNDTLLQREWERPRFHRPVSKSDPRSARDKPAADALNDDPLWECEWRRACIADMQLEGEWERQMGLLHDRLNCGVCVDIADVPEHPENLSAPSLHRPEARGQRRIGGTHRLGEARN